jgi:hypothetical protein
MSYRIGTQSALGFVPVYVSGVATPIFINQGIVPSDKRMDNVWYKLVGRFSFATVGLRTVTIGNTAGSASRLVMFDSVYVVGDCPDTTIPVAVTCPADKIANTDTGKAFATYNWTYPTWTDDNGMIFIDNHI